MTTDPLPEARLVPQDGADRMTVLRGQATASARKAGRAAITATKVVAVLALLGMGIAAIGGATGGRSRSREDLDRSIQRLRRMPTPKLPRPELQQHPRSRALEGLTSEQIHQIMPR